MVYTAKNLAVFKTCVAQLRRGNGAVVMITICAKLTIVESGKEREYHGQKMKFFVYFADMRLDLFLAFM